MYTYTYIRARIRLFSEYTGIFLQTHTHTDMYMRAHTYAYIRGRIYVDVYGVHLNVHVCMHIHINTHTYMYICGRTCLFPEYTGHPEYTRIHLSLLP